MVLNQNCGTPFKWILSQVVSESLYKYVFTTLSYANTKYKYIVLPVPYILVWYFRGMK